MNLRTDTKAVATTAPGFASPSSPASDTRKRAEARAALAQAEDLDRTLDRVGERMEQ